MLSATTLFPEEPPVFNEPEPVSQTAAAEPTPAEEEDDSKYKWLGFKATNLDEDDGLNKGRLEEKLLS